MKKKYLGLVPELEVEIPISSNEMSTFVAHFGRLGNVEIYDPEKNETILNSIGTIIDKFYPNMANRELAYHKSKHLFHYFEDFKNQCNRKYPTGELRKIYKDLINNVETLPTMSPVTSMK